MESSLIAKFTLADPVASRTGPAGLEHADHITAGRRDRRTERECVQYARRECLYRRRPTTVYESGVQSAANTSSAIDPPGEPAYVLHEVTCHVPDGSV